MPHDVPYILQQLRITDAELDEYAECCRFAIDDYVNDSRPLTYQPTILAVVRDLRKPAPELHITTLNVPFNAPEEQSQAMRRLGARLYEKRKLPLAFFLSSEAWRSSHTGDGPGQYPTPAEDPDRVATVIYQGLSVENRCRVGARLIRRGDDERIVFAGEWDISRPDDSVQLPLVGECYRGFLPSFASR